MSGSANSPIVLDENDDDDDGVHYQRPSNSQVKQKIDRGLAIEGAAGPDDPGLVPSQPDSRGSKSGYRAVRLEARLQSVMGSAWVGVQLNLRALAMMLRNTMYVPTRSAALCVRTRRPDATVMVYGSGKLACSGCRSDGDCLRALRVVARQIQLATAAHPVDLDAATSSKGAVNASVAVRQNEAAARVRFLRFSIHNRTASCDFGFRVRLEALAFEHRDKASFESEVSSACTFYMTEPTLTWLVYSSGRCIINQIANITNLQTGLAKMFAILTKFRLD
jgi:transcription initiation factor TFIID TATA-box-binding protein